MEAKAGLSRRSPPGGPQAGRVKGAELVDAGAPGYVDGQGQVNGDGTQADQGPGSPSWAFHPHHATGSLHRQREAGQQVVDGIGVGRQALVCQAQEVPEEAP